MGFCKNICEQLKCKNSKNGVSRYKLGQQWCATCQLFLVKDKIKCPCCKNRLRTKSRKNKSLK